VPASCSFGSESYSAVLTVKKKILLCQAYGVRKIQGTEDGLSEAVLSL